MILENSFGYNLPFLGRTNKLKINGACDQEWFAVRNNSR